MHQAHLVHCCMRICDELSKDRCWDLVLPVSSGCRDGPFMEAVVCQVCADMDRRPVPQVYEKLNAEGRFQEKLLEMYRWGKVNGWDAAPSAVQ